MRKGCRIESQLVLVKVFQQVAIHLPDQMLYVRHGWMPIGDGAWQSTCKRLGDHVEFGIAVENRLGFVEDRLADTK
jgi:hypothetical protein